MLHRITGVSFAIWLVVPTSFAVYSSNLRGFVQNPMASAEPFAIGFNTQWLA